MDDIERQILNYDELPADERRAVDAYLDAHPEAASLLDEGRAVRSLLEEAARFGTKVPDAESIAHFVVAQHLAQRPLPDDIAALGEHIEESFAEHPEVERQYSMMQDRLKTLTAEAESPRVQFERLTGHRLGARHHTTSADQPVEPPPAVAPAAHRDRSKGWRTSVTDHLSLLQRISLPRLALAATFVVALLYGSLFVASRAGQPERIRLADLDAVEKEFAGLRLRGPDGQLDLATDRYAEALETLSKARTTVLGLFPSYDAEDLTESIRLLEQVVELEGPDSALSLEAWFVIGKILLHQGEVGAAQDALQIVVDRGGPSAPDAQRLLDELGTIAPAPTPGN